VIEINKNPSRSELKWFGLLLLVFLGVVGAVVNWRFHAPAAARGLWMAGVGLCLVYYALPVLRRPMFISGPPAPEVRAGRQVLLGGARPERRPLSILPAVLK
jgi:hypothetical protein